MKNNTKDSSNQIRLIIGIGNPSAKYENTYHNVGIGFVLFLAKQVSEDAKAKNIKWKKRKYFKFFKPETGPILATSNTFMNQSGLAVKSAMKKFGLKPQNILVAQDESDIEIGKYKMSFGARSAGHKGVDSIINQLGTNELWRIRFGIRKNSGLQVRAMDKAKEFVLKNIGRKDAMKLETAFNSASSEYVKLEPSY